MRRAQLVLAFVVVELKTRLEAGTLQGPFSDDDVRSLSPYDREFETWTIALSDAEIEATMRACESAKLVTAYRSQLWKTRYVASHDAISAFVSKNSMDTDNPIHQYSVLGVWWLAEVLRNLERGKSKPVAAIAARTGDALKGAGGETFALDASRLADASNIANEQGFSQPTVEPDSSIVPAADRYVSLSHNSRELKEVKATLDEAIEALRGLNADLDEETAAKIVELTAGRKLLEAPQVNLRFVEDMIVASLVHLSERTFNVGLDSLITAALTAVLVFFGLSLQ